HALAGVLHVGRGAAALALARVLACATRVAALTAALALTRVLALADVLVRRSGLVLGLLVGRSRLLLLTLGPARLLRHHQAGARDDARDREAESLHLQITLLHPASPFVAPALGGSPTNRRSRHGPVA